MPRVALTLAATALCTVALFAPAALAAPAEFAGSSSDGEKVFFTTSSKVVPGDTDNGFIDVYERFYDGAAGIETSVTREISTGPTGGNDSYNVTFDGVSSDGNSVFFSTAESLVEEDADHSRDIYERDTASGDTILVSGGSPLCTPCGNGEVPVTFVGATPTGSKVFFATSEALTETDGDGAGDVYAREASAIAPSLVTPGTSAPATFLGASKDGSQVVFETTDKLSVADTDSEGDIYERDLGGGMTRLVSVNGTCPALLAAEECAPVYRSTDAGGAVLFETNAQLVGADGDKFQDVYRWSPLTETADLISTGSQAEEGKGEFDSVFAGLAAGGDTVFFASAERLSTSDEDHSHDIYERTGGTTELASPGSDELPAFFNAASADGATIVFSTTESLLAGDEGEKLDVYEHSGSTTQLVSAGSAQSDSTFAGASSDASHVFYVTSQQLDPAKDLDSNPDIYGWDEGAEPTLVSTGPEGGNDAFTPHLSAVSEDADHVFFATRERLTADDNFATENDVYDRSQTKTLLVSVGNSAELQLGPPAPSLTGTNPASPNVSVEPRVLGQAEAGTLIKLYPTADCSGAPAGTGTAAELKGTGLKAVVKAGSTTTFHATATNSSDTSACSGSSITYVQRDASLPPPVEEGGGSSGGGAGPGTPGGSGTPSSGATGNPKPADTPAVVRIGNFLYVAPLTRITVGPLAKTRSRRPIFQFIDATEQPNTKFLCRIDRGSWKPCSSPYRPKRLSLHKHVFAVKGESFAGQWEQHPVVRKFKVVGR